MNMRGSPVAGFAAALGASIMCEACAHLLVQRIEIDVASGSAGHNSPTYRLSQFIPRPRRGHLCFKASASGLVNAVDYFKVEWIEDARVRTHGCPLLVLGGSANIQALSVTVGLFNRER